MEKEVVENRDVSFWGLDLNAAFRQVKSTRTGLGEKDIELRRKQYGANRITFGDHQTDFLLFLNQFKSPITIILLLVAALSYFLNDHTKAVIIFVIVLTSSGLGFWQ